jgi:hypothetical protein
VQHDNLAVNIDNVKKTRIDVEEIFEINSRRKRINDLEVDDIDFYYNAPIEGKV